MKYVLRTTALAYLGALVLVPLVMIFYRTFEHGFSAFWASVTSRAIWASAVSAPTRVARTTRRPPAKVSPASLKSGMTRSRLTRLPNQILR